MQTTDAPHDAPAIAGHAHTIPALDGLRGCAALIVFVSHYSNDFALWHGALGSGAGQTGVMLFFILSGFLMAYLHIGTDVTPANVWNYTVRRAARIYPLFVVVAAVQQLQPLIGSSAAPGPGVWITILRQISFIDPGSSILWTVRVEVTFYVVFIAIWFFHARVGRRDVTACVLVAILVLLRSTWLGDWGVFLPTCRYFLFGTLSALFMPPRQKTAPVAVSVVSLLLFASIPFTFPVVARKLFHADLRPWNSDIIAVQIVLLFNAVVRWRGWLTLLLSTAAARWLGRVSYSLYLLQPFVLQFVLSRVGVEISPIFSGALVLAGVLAAAGLSHRFLELPAQRCILRAGRAMSGKVTRVA